MASINIPPCPLDPIEIEDDLSYTTDVESSNNTAKGDKYIVVFTLPNCFTPLNTKNKAVNEEKISQDSITFTVFSIPTPQISVPSDAQWAHGRAIKLSTLTRDEYDPISLQFAIDSRYQNYWTIYKWLDIMADSDDNGFDRKNKISGPARLKSYTTTLVIYAVDEWNKPKMRFEYYGAFPTTLSEIEHSQQNEEELVVSADFEFSFMKITPYLAF